MRGQLQVGAAPEGVADTCGRSWWASIDGLSRALAWRGWCFPIACALPFRSVRGPAVRSSTELQPQDVIQLQKARKLLSTQVRLHPSFLSALRWSVPGLTRQQWGFNEHAGYRAGTTVLLLGPPGTGKTAGTQAAHSSPHHREPSLSA